MVQALLQQAFGGDVVMNNLVLKQQPHYLAYQRELEFRHVEVYLNIFRQSIRLFQIQLSLLGQLMHKVRGFLQEFEQL